MSGVEDVAAAGVTAEEFAATIKRNLERMSGMTGMDDLVTWLRAQLDEDERVAKVASMLSKPPWSSRITHDPDGYVSGRIVDDRGYTVVHVEDQTPGPAEADHIARWDPVRVLAEVAAKRRILDAYEMVLGQQAENSAKFVAMTDGRVSNEAEYVRVKTHGWMIRGRLDGLRAAIYHLALPYADRPGYREEWRP